MRRLIATLLLLATAPALATSTSEPVNLGATGLSPVLRLWKWDSVNGWTAQSTSGLSVNDLTTGEYTVSGLPDATGTDRYVLVIAEAGDTASAYATYSWGAQPGETLIWRIEYEPPDSPLVFKQYDTYGRVSLEVTRGLPSAISTATATFSAWDHSAGAVEFSGRAATISDVTLDVNSQTYGATFSYAIQSGDLDSTGRFRGEFEVDYGVSGKETLPKDDSLTWSVVADYDGS